MLKFRTVALGAVAVFGFAALAGAQVPAQQDSMGRRLGPRQGQMGPRGQRGMRGMGGMHGMRGMAARRHGRFMAELNLTASQKNQIKAIHLRYQPQFDALRDQATAQFRAIRDARQKGDTTAAARQRFQTQREQLRQRMTTLHQQEQNDIRGILTAEQRAKWDAAMAQRQARFQNMRK